VPSISRVSPADIPEAGHQPPVKSFNVLPRCVVWKPNIEKRLTCIEEAPAFSYDFPPVTYGIGDLGPVLSFAVPGSRQTGLLAGAANPVNRARPLALQQHLRLCRNASSVLICSTKTVC
jgi:hypothetical protein